MRWGGKALRLRLAQMVRVSAVTRQLCELPQTLLVTEIKRGDEARWIVALSFSHGDNPMIIRKKT